ncbi:ExeM/NucH family extracellular endonuclease [Deinococcus soli (ex Cha et al. 2016)]|uniref:Extracellular nuclease n=2 Tax=Deinococcus soli (ex Cha et al. 2016) TaxID=1309411 RepID=A0ACC6KBS7_9DEIO|nr:ExeM/NucH family extracellular endonuclease [Deinococcus soli (ex Cha et al. 2016)]MDR6216892.1 putative extracellular nuclease [Deinococcus soli (ex Cha et al. 2016)]MDR6327713.1 putative extracellular nuclease [Deinococcus soli (ex Cha et al. 2016)]MDR6749988.1 putative extracellular nuclease [Deinococcus soli (ex Cha et al. 2016)]
MNAKSLLLAGLLALTACGTTTPVTITPAPTVNKARTFGLYELRVNQGSAATVQSVTGQAAEIPFDQLSFTRTSMTNMVDEVSRVVHMTATFTVTNNTGATITLPTFIPVDTDGTYATDGTGPFRNVRTRTGTPVSSRGMAVEIAHTNSGGAIAPDPAATPFLTNIDSGTLGLTLPAGTTAPNIGHRGWQTAQLPAGSSQTVTFAARVPLQGTEISDVDPFTFSLVFAVADNPGTVTNLTGINTVQGATPSGNAATPVSGQSVAVEGVVTSVHTTNATTSLRGFFLQEEEIDIDGDVTTSDGIFVYCDTSCPSVSAGDRVRVTGTAGEAFNNTQITTTAAGVTTLTTGVPLPDAQPLTLPLDFSARERLEGMRVTTSGVVTNNFTLGRGASFDIADARVPNFTQLNAPDIAANAAYQTTFKNRYIRIDDGSRVSNPDPEIFARGGQSLSAANTLRGGDAVSVTGVLGYGNDGWTGSGSIDTYRIHATQTSVQVTDGNPRLSAPEAVGGTLRVGAMNVLNYFTTLVTSNTGCTPNGVGGSAARGANTCEEFLRQQDKIVAAISGLNADVLNLMEIQNDFDKGSSSSVALLVQKLNATLGAGTYAYINPGAKVGTDAISLAMIYKPAAVTPVGNLAILTNAFDPNYADTCNRPTWAQTFQSNSNGGRFTAVAMHLKSKGSSCAATSDADIGDGQGNGYKARRNAATAIANWLATNPTGVDESDRLLMGDFNAYAMEEPLSILANAGYANLFDRNVYSYQFDGQWGSLDQAVGSASLAAQVTGKTKWHINADEPTVLDYNREFKSAGQLTSLYAPDAFRSSDHDPLLIGLNLTAQTPIVVTNPTTTLTPASASANVNLGSSVTGTFTTSSTDITTLNVATTLTKTDGAAAGTNPTVTAPTTTAPNGPFDVTVTAAADTTPGAYRVTVGTSSGSASASATYDVNVNGILLSAPSNLSYGVADAATGATTSAAVTAYGAGTVSYSASATGDGAPSITVTPGTTTGNTTPLTVTATGGSAGTYTATLTATGTNGQTASRTFTVTVTAAPTGRLVISEFRLRGPSGAADEFIELVNIGSAPLDISGYVVQGNTNNTANWALRATIPASTVLQPGQFYLVVNNNNNAAGGYSLAASAAGDLTYATGVTDNRAIRVIDTNGAAVDTVGFAATTAQGVLCEGTCIANGPTTGVTTQISWARNVSGGQFVDTDNNASDFTYRDGASSGTANPQNKAVIFSGTN